MSLALRRSAPVRRFAVVCFGFERDRIRRQPWHVAAGIADGLSALGHEVTVISDSVDPPGERAFGVATVPRLIARGSVTPELREAVAATGAERVYLVTGALALARMRPLGLGSPVTLVMASPRASVAELLRPGVRALWRERGVVALPAVNALLPGALLRRGFARSGAEDVLYLSRAARIRYSALGLPYGRLLRPQVAGAVCVDLPPAVGPRRVAYFGPALSLRGVDLVVDTFERATRLGLDARLELLIRPDGGAAALARLHARIARSPVADRIDLETRMLDEAALRARLAACHAFLLPFRVPVSEVPLVVIEAGLSNRPVVVLEAPGVSEYATALGGIVAARPDDLPHALLHALRRAPAPAPDPAAWTRWDRAVDAILDLPGGRLHDYRLLAVCGVDGSGKSLLVDRLRVRLESEGVATRHVWSRFRNYLSKPLLALARLTGHNRKEHHPGFTIGYHEFCGTAYARPFLALQAVDTALDTLLRFRGRELVIADRCALDTLVDLCVDTGLDDIVLERLAPRLLRFLPRPAAAVVVLRSPRLIAAQRPDAMADRNFARRRALYLRLAARLGLPVVENDGPVEATLEAILGAVDRGLADLRRVA